MKKSINNVPQMVLPPLQSYSYPSPHKNTGYRLKMGNPWDHPVTDACFLFGEQKILISNSLVSIPNLPVQTILSF